MEQFVASIAEWGSAIPGFGLGFIVGLVVGMIAMIAVLIGVDTSR